MDKLRLCFVDFWPEFPDENIFLPILKKHFDVVIDDNHPNVVIHSIFNRMQNTPKYKCKKILFVGENHDPYKFGSDYSISFAPHSPTNFRLPLWQVFLILRPELKDKLFDKVKWNEDEFDRFCSFTVSNPVNFLRNNMFSMLSQYKRVHSYGRYLTNSLELQEMSKGRYWRDAKYEFFMKVKHKFCIAFENNSYPGYTTEKILDSYLANSLPIYWGNFKINEEFNEKSFINVMKFHIGDLIEYIKLLDNDEEKFMKIYNEPVFTDEQKKNLLENIENFEKWLVDSVNK
jgi:hypothetical protein